MSNTSTEKNSAHTLGKAGENLATDFLKEKGLKILEINWRVRHLEIDLIAESTHFIHIVEVKTRSGTAFGTPESFISREKQKHLIQAANSYARIKQVQKEIRFDIVAIVSQNEKFHIEWIEDAFMPQCR